MDAGKATSSAAALANDNAFVTAASRYKLHIIAAGAFLSVATAAHYAAPNFASVVHYFWPLLLSTALLFVAVVVFGRSSPSDLADGAGGGIMNYVAGGSEERVAMGEGAGESSTSASRPEELTQ